MGVARAGLSGVSGLQNQPSAQIIDGSYVFNKDLNGYLERTPSSAGNRRTWTWSGWIKKYSTGIERVIFNVHDGSNNYTRIRYVNSDQFQVYMRIGSGTNYYSRLEEIHRDGANGWYHLVVSVDTTESTATDRVKIYVNGELRGKDTDSTIPQNDETAINSTIKHSIGSDYGSNEWEGSISNFYLIDGAALGPGNFGFTDPLTNIWKPKKFRHDKRFYGKTFSNQLSPSDGPWRNSNPKSNGFDGSAATSIALDTVEGTLTFSPNFGEGPFEIEYKGFNDGQTTATIDGTALTYTSGSIWTGTVNTFNTLTLVAAANNRPGITYIKVNGYMLVDSAVDNSFYLPFDGSAPVGEDQIPNGNDYTTINISGSAALDKATGAKPILNTTQGGAVAALGVFGSLENKYYTVTTANGSVYQFDITSGDNPSLSFIRGATYTFDYSSHSSHPLRFSSTNPDSSTTAYTDGTSVSGNLIKFTVPHNAPDTLYYYCTAHASAMNGSISVTTDETKADPYAWKCTLALPCYGNSDDVSHLINCTTSELPIANQGNAHADLTTGNFYSGSFDLDNSGDYINVNSSSPYSHVDFGTGDYTAECWVYLEGTGDEYVFNMSTDHGGAAPWWGINFYSTNLIRAGRTNGSGDPIHMKTTTFATNKWIHIAVARESGTSRLFLDGTLIDTQSDSDDITPDGNLNIGAYNNGGLELNGFVQDARIYNGVAKYTSSFIPASASPDIIPDSPSGVSGSGKLTKITEGAVSLDGSGDYLYIPPSSDWNFGTGAYTLEAFINTAGTGIDQEIFDLGLDGTHTSGSDIGFRFRIGTNDILYAANHSGGSVVGQCYDTGSTPISKGRWYHIAYVRDGNNFATFVDGQRIATGTSSSSVNWNSAWGVKLGYAHAGGAQHFFGQISNARIIKGTALYDPTATSVSYPTKPLTNVTNTKLLCCQSNTSANSADVGPGTFSNTGTTYSSNLSGAIAGSPYDATKMFDGSLTTYTDHNAQNSTFTWTQTLTSVTSLRVYIHGGSSTNTVTTVGGSGTQTDTISTNFGPGWHDIALDTTGSTINSIAFARGGSGNFLSVYAVEVNGTILIDGFYGEAIARVGDTSASTVNPFDTDVNTVRGEQSNYCTLNPLAMSDNLSLSNGNLECSANENNHHAVLGTFSMNSGKWYYEMKLKNGVAAPDIGWHIMPYAYSDLDQFNGTSRSGSFCIATDGNNNNVRTHNNGTATIVKAESWATGDVIGCAIDMDSKKIWFRRNSQPWYPSTNGGTYGNPETGSDPSITYTTSNYLTPRTSAYSSTYTPIINFGQKPFKFSPPDGFRPVNNAAARPVTVVSRPDQYVGVTTYNGNGTGRSFDTGMKPDLVWIKVRNINGYNHQFFDSVRGAGKRLQTNNTNAEDTDTNTLAAFNIDGFRVGTNNGVNQSDKTYVAWSWKAGGNKGTFNKDDVGYATAAAAGLTAGNITPTGASVGTKQGFSIIAYTGDGQTDGEVPHGLNQSPDLVIIKSTNQTQDWKVHTPGLTSQYLLTLNENYAQGHSSWDGVTNTVFKPARSGDTYLNTNTYTYIAFCWHNVPGLQKFGTYKGSGSTANGPFVDLGFRPAIVWVKNIDTAASWVIYDDQRGPINPNAKVLNPNGTGGGNANDAFVGSYPIDILSNGFRIRNNTGEINNSDDFIYCAWAKSPTIDLYGGGANAR